MSARPEPAISRSDRWRALGLLLGALALAYGLLIHPWWTLPMLRLGDDINALRERAARVQALLAQAPEIASAVVELQDDTAAAPGFLREANVQLATAALVQHLETTVREISPGNRSCAIMNRTPLADPRAGRFQRAAVQVRLACGNAELGAVLYALESGHPRLFIDNLNVIAQRQQRPASGGGGGGVDVSFDLYGYLPPSAAAGGLADAP